VSATVAGSLEIQMLMNLARLQSDMNQAKSMVGGAMRDIERAVDRVKAVFGTGFVATGLAMVAKQAMEGEQAINRLDAVIRATGNASGYTRDQLQGLADAMAEVTQFDDEDIRTATASLLKFGNMHGKVLTEALKLSADYAAFTGTNMASAAETLGKAISSPAQGVERLQRAIGYLNPAQVDAIKRMQEMGDVAGAQATLMQILTQKIGGVADAMNTGYTKAFNDAKKATGEFFETVGNSWAVQATTQSFLGFVTQSMRDMKHIIEDGDWVQALKFIMGFRQTDAQAAARRPASALGAGSGAGDQAALEARRAFDAQLAEQDERAIKEMLARQKKANEERQRDAFATAQLIQRGEEESAQESAEAWQYWDKFVLAEEKKALEERLALGDAYVREQEMAAEDVTEAWIYYNKFIVDQDRKRVEEARAQWGGFIDGVESAFRDSWNTIGKSWGDALESMKNAFQRILLDFIYQSLAKPFLLTIVAGVAQSAGMTGLATMATGAAGSAIGGSSMASSAMAAAAGMGPVGWAVLAVAAVAAVAYAFRDKGENWRAQFGFGENAMSPYSTQGVFGTEGFAQIQGQDAFARAMQEFMAGTRELDEVLARHLSADSIDRIVASLAGPYATRADGQPSEFAFARGQEGEAAAQLTLEYLQKKYGTIFDEIDGTFAEFIRSYTGKSEDLLAEIGAFVTILEQLSQLDIPGLDVSALRAMARDGEALGDTFARVSGEMNTMREQFLTDVEKLNLAKEALSGLFGDMALLGMRAPADNAAWLELFESLDLGIEAEREMHDRMVALAPAFLAVGDASERAAQQAQQAADSIMSSFHSIMASIRGPGYTGGRMQTELDSSLNAFRGQNSWASGYDNQGLMGQLLTITDADMANYALLKPASAELIVQILNLYHSLQSLTDPISTVGTAVGTILAPTIDTAAIAADHLNARLALLAQIYDLNGDAVSAAAIRDHQRAIALEEIRKQDSANGTPGILEGLTTSLWALQDAAEAAAELVREQEEAASGVIGTMQELVRMMDQVASFRESLAGSIQSIRSQMPGFDAIGYQSGQVSRFRGQLAGAGSIEERLTAGGKLRDAIMARYQAEMDAANALHQEQENAARAGIDAANELNQAFRSLGDYAKSLLTGELSTLSPGQKLAESGRQYQDLLARARGGDMAALGGLQGAASDYLTQARGYYASSDSYVRIFEEVQGALADLGARAGPEQVYQENTAAWQASLLEIQMRAIDELTSLESLTDAWQQELQEQLVEQAIVFSQIGLSTAQIAENTKDLDTRIASAINTAVAAAVRANGDIAQVQMDRDDEWYERQYDATKKLPGQLATAVAVTDRR